MSEESKENIEGSETKIDYHQPDWFLQNLVGIVNGSDMKIGLTFNIGGFLVSGLLISGDKYFEGFANDYVSNMEDPEAKQDVKAPFLKVGEDLYKNNESKNPPTYIHLENAKFFNTNGNPIPGNRGVWWRGRVSEISGFFLGNLSNN